MSALSKTFLSPKSITLSICIFPRVFLDAYDVKKLFGIIIVSTPVGVNNFKHASINTWYKSNEPERLYFY